MKNIFCKIIELENHQVLIRKSFEEDGDGGTEYKLIVTMNFEGIEVSVDFGYDDEKMMNKAFEKFDTQWAKSIAEQIDEMMNGNPLDGDDPRTLLS